MSNQYYFFGTRTTFIQAFTSFNRSLAPSLAQNRSAGFLRFVSLCFIYLFIFMTVTMFNTTNVIYQSTVIKCMDYFYS